MGLKDLFGLAFMRMYSQRDSNGLYRLPRLYPLSPPFFAYPISGPRNVPPTAPYAVNHRRLAACRHPTGYNSYAEASPWTSY
jgi:hypothetical protein